MPNFYFDICAIPLYLLILIVCYSRRMTEGTVNRMFITLVFISLVSTLADLGLEIPNALGPLTGGSYILCGVSAYVYIAVRNASNLVNILFLMALTRTTFLFRKRWFRTLFFLPYAVTMFLLLMNPIIHGAFSVTEAGYARGPLRPVIYFLALFYGVGGLVYCVYCRRYLPRNKWAALLSIYVLAYLAVAVEFFHPELLLELFCTAIGTLVILFSVMRPEERMDSDVGLLSWVSYQKDLENILLTHERVWIIVASILNSQELRSYLGDHRYYKLVAELGGAIREFPWIYRSRIELYFENPGIIYIVADGEEPDIQRVEPLLAEATARLSGRFAEQGVRLESRLCLIRCPQDLNRKQDIIGLGHNYHNLDKQDRSLLLAEEIVHTRTFALESHMEEILHRVLTNRKLEMHYQPIYDVKTGTFHSAEALARINDPDFGQVPPGSFIPGAEIMCLILPLGDLVLESVFRFVSTHDLKALGLSYIELNLSVAQCMKAGLPETVRQLQEKYGVDPGQINMEITETNFGSISEVMERNLRELADMGYSFALDDYGTGYSSIQRVLRLPLTLIKIDKSMLDEAETDSGRSVLQHTIHMMQRIGKQVVTEGAETLENVETLREMGSDYIQGYYFSKPLPEADFLRFLEEHRHGG